MPGMNRGAHIHLAQLAAKCLVEQGLKEVLGLAGGFPLLTSQAFIAPSDPGEFLL